jgi:hypothetical protein
MWLVSQNVGIAVSYHRRLTHRGFTTPKWLEHAMALCRAMALAHPHAGAVRLAKDIKVTRTDTVRSGKRPNKTLPLQSLGAAPAK